MENINQVIEAIIFASGSPIAKSAILEKFPDISTSKLNQAIKDLQKKYSEHSGVLLKEFNGKVQFMSNESIIQPGDNLLKDISQFEYYVQNNVYKYVTGSFYKSSQAKELQDEVRKKGFKDAFVVAFYKGERITLQQAKEIIMEIGIGGED